MNNPATQNGKQNLVQKPGCQDLIKQNKEQLSTVYYLEQAMHQNVQMPSNLDQQSTEYWQKWLQLEAREHMALW